jgi:hypothetical protein
MLLEVREFRTDSKTQLLSDTTSVINGTALRINQIYHLLLMWLLASFFTYHQGIA